MEILIIDSGVYFNHPALRLKKIDGYGLTYNSDTQCCVRIDDFEDQIGHGTAVFDLIQRNCPEAKIKNIKIFNHDFDLSEEAFCSVLEYVYKNENPTIINLSLGLTVCENESKLYEICKKIQDKGAMIFSAFDNCGAISYPAVFDCVYGVNGDPQISSADKIYITKDSYVNIFAKGTISRLMWRNPDYIYLSGNSFSCAMVTGQVASAIMNGKINERAFNIGTEKKMESKKPCFQIKKAALFPLNKEMHSLLRFQSMLSFEIVAVYDHRLTGRVGSSVGRALKCDEADDLVVRDIANICWEEFDTLILGHTDELIHLTQDNPLIKRLFALAQKYGKCIYSFDPCENSEHTFYPEVNKKDLPQNHYGKLFKINKPVLGILGTSSRQGKFSLQLGLTNAFKKKGYHVGCLGTEPSALLFGIDEIFPYGYNSTVSLSESEAVLYLNRLMKKISLTDCEIILVGSQSAELTGELNNLCQITMHQQAFLYGTAPDAIILVVSAHDTVEYIQRTISYVESVCDCEVIAVGFLPRYIIGNDWGVYEKYIDMNENEIVQFKDYIQMHIGVKAFVIGNRTDETLLTEQIIEFF